VGASASRAAAGTERTAGDRLVGRGRRRQSYPRSFGGLHTGPSPVDRARAGSKHHLITDAGGIPLAISLTGGQRNDVTQLLPLIDAVGPIAGKPGRPRKRAEAVLADRGYDHEKYRRELRKRGVKPLIARRGSEHGSGLGKERWVVERTFAWLHNLRRLRIRYERSADLHLAFMLLGCAVVCQRRLSAA
jgi:transposase